MDFDLACIDILWGHGRELVIMELVGKLHVNDKIAAFELNSVAAL